MQTEGPINRKALALLWRSFRNDERIALRVYDGTDYHETFGVAYYDRERAETFAICSDFGDIAVQWEWLDTCDVTTYDTGANVYRAIVVHL